MLQSVNAFLMLQAVFKSSFMPQTDNADLVLQTAFIDVPVVV
jgi:hypothetical protein